MMWHQVASMVALSGAGSVTLIVQTAASPELGLPEYGILGTVLLLTTIAVRVLFQRQVQTHDQAIARLEKTLDQVTTRADKALEHANARADTAEQRLESQNGLIRDQLANQLARTVEVMSRMMDDQLGDARRGDEFKAR